MPPRQRIRATTLSLTLSLILIAPVGYGAPQKPRARRNQPQGSAQQKALTNADIVRMVKNAFSDDMIISTIQNSKTQFDLSVDGLIGLKNSGVSERIISVMQAPQSTGRSSPRPSAPAIEGNRSQPAIVSIPAPRLEQPYVLVTYGATKEALPLEPTHVGRAEAKGDDLGALAKDQAIDKVYNGVELAAATRVGNEVDKRLAAIPIIGVATGVGGTMMGGVSKVGRIFHKPKPVTYLWALPGRSSVHGLRSSLPQFEMVYGEIPGIDPDEYEPFVVRLVQTRENWRLVGATKADPDAFQKSKWDIYSAFIEERIPARINKTGRGRYLIALETALQAGEYGIVLRPIEKSKVFSGDDITNRKNAGVLFDTVWTFSFAP